MSQAGLMPLIAAWLRDTQGVEPVAPRPNATGAVLPPVAPAPVPERPPPQDPPAGPWRYPARTKAPEPVSLNRADPVLQWANWRLAQASPEAVEESMLSGGGPVGVGAPGSTIAGVVRSRLGQATRGAKAETAAQTAKLAQAEAGAQGPAIIVPGKRVPQDAASRVRAALERGEILPEFAPYMGPWEGQYGRAETLADLVTMGQEAGGGKWYAGMKDLFPKLYRSTNPTAQAGVMASLSPQREAQALTLKGTLHKGSNPEMWRRVMDVYEQHGLRGIEDLVGPHRQISIMGSQRENVLRALRGERIGGEDALKIQDFQGALVEEPRVALDRWWKRIFHPVEHAAGKTGFTPAQYFTGRKVITDWADEQGMDLIDAGGAAWVGIKLIDEGKAQAMLGGQPFKDTLRQVWAAHGRDLTPFGPQAEKIAMGLALGTLILQGQMPGAEAGPAARRPASDAPLTRKVFGE